MRNKFTKETTQSEILEDSQTHQILVKYQGPCLGCPFAVFEIGKLKLGEVCEMYNIDLKSLLKELNRLSSEKARITSQKHKKHKKNAKRKQLGK